MNRPELLSISSFKHYYLGGYKNRNGADGNINWLSLSDYIALSTPLPGT